MICQNLPRRFDADVDRGSHFVRVRESRGERRVHGGHQDAFSGITFYALFNGVDIQICEKISCMVQYVSHSFPKPDRNVYTLLSMRMSVHF